MKLLYPDPIPNVPEKTRATANTDFSQAWAQNTKVYDLAFDAQARIELQLMVNANPRATHYWPSKESAICGYVPGEKESTYWSLDIKARAEKRLPLFIDARGANDN